MTKNQEKIFNEAIDAIKKNKLVFIEDVIAYISIVKSTFYEYFPLGSDESDKIKELLNKNKIDLKVSMRSKWYKSTAPALQMGLYKLLASDEELKKLSMQHVDHTTKDEKLEQIVVFKIPDNGRDN